MLGGGINPIGTILAYGGKDTPENYLFCDGRQISKLEYPDLYAVIGDLYRGGVELGENMFRLPCIIDRRYIFGVGNMSQQLYYDDGLPNITGLINVAAYNSDGYSGAFYRDGTSANVALGTSGNSRINKVYMDASRMGIYGKSDRVTPRSTGVRFIIRAY